MEWQGGEGAPRGGYIRIVEDGYNLFCIKFRVKSEPRVVGAPPGFILESAWFFLDEDLSPLRARALKHARISRSHLRHIIASRVKY